ncbi:UDP-N-acetylmuramoyl-L-alanine--D-glutamate ligase [Paenibacillus kyungheensis]|uniref:UDP-N-acetylmuramoylalanine--D-glutamate ligase n=1 Tax=Paenibacillus kyungheensis TaxID=1452732 RepID=A0AAX3LXT4_9BACL|nr:UDP-N-acetylmuramoyl-L-alanine--D-glutamate ligase [Paenibacillus kyungheensis]WCT54580.1 UDP-N-acetylmuramoyl-L-alanine--D-glutamate ligase [Paenibacillus kyungheensis]
MNDPETYRGQQVIVIGLARSGVEAAKALHRLGAIVTVNDLKPREQSPEAAELEALDIQVICGGHPEGLIHKGIALMVKNPGIPYTAPPIKQALDLGIEVITEVELAYRISDVPMIGITGSNGKTTTTTWVGKMLEANHLHPIVGGNIGIPLCEAVSDAQPENWIVAELSSFQLKGTRDFNPKIACLLNVAETHLDYHGSMDDYVSSKRKIFENQGKDDTAIINWDDSYCRSLVPYIQAGTLIPFSITENLGNYISAAKPSASATHSPLSAGLYVSPAYIPEMEDELPRTMMYCDQDGEVAILPVQELGIPGRYNVANALAACAIAITAGCRPQDLADVLRDFRGVEHRLEYVKEHDQVQYYNNSKATNAKATMTALSAFQDKGIVLIAGGLDRGSDYMDLLPVFQQQVKALVVLGQTRHKLAKVAELAGITKVQIIEESEQPELAIKQAVEQAAMFAEPDNIVLLSPACASWDMFSSYEERGRAFKEAVHQL